MLTAHLFPSTSCDGEQRNLFFFYKLYQYNMNSANNYTYIFFVFCTCCMCIHTYAYVVITLATFHRWKYHKIESIFQLNKDKNALN